MSKFVVSARKYRPQTFDEVVGQSHVSDTLKKALEVDKLAHAYLFCGPRGVGKTTCARILAKVVNCEQKPNQYTACGICPSCKSFEDNASFNILELDAASNNSVDNIRSLIDQVRIRPQHGTHKIFIIDEVHMLSTSAFNAFLKTLEEPPEYVIFIMATTEKHKILPTILSRCQIYDFKRIQASDIVPQLEYICQKEGKTADKEALHIIGQKADGAMRDALSIFDRIASSTGNHISYKDVVSNLNILDYDYFFKITDYLMLSQIDKILLGLDEIIQNGFEPDQFIYGLTEHFRNLLVVNYPSTVDLLDVGDQLKERYTTQAKTIQLTSLMSFLNLANECDIQYPTAKNKRLHVEIALSKMAYAGQLVHSSDFSTEKKNHSLSKNESKEITQSNSSISTTKIEETPANQATEKTPEKVSDPEPQKAIEKKSEVKSQVKEETDTNSEKKIDNSKTEKPVEPQTRAQLANDPIAISTLGVIDLPSMHSDLASKLREIKEKEEKLKDLQIEITEEAVQECILNYIKTVDSKSLIETLKIVQIEVKEHAVELFTPSIIARETVQQQENLLLQIREKFHRLDLAIPILIDMKRFPDYEVPVVKKELTDAEKYTLMAEKNPNISILQKKFDLNP